MQQKLNKNTWLHSGHLLSHHGLGNKVGQLLMHRLAHAFHEAECYLATDCAKREGIEMMKRRKRTENDKMNSDGNNLYWTSRTDSLLKQLMMNHDKIINSNNDYIIITILVFTSSISTAILFIGCG